MAEIVIKAEDISFSYESDHPADQIPVLNHLNLEIEKGSFVAVLGHNGSGKSTMAKLFNLILTPTSGNLYLFGKKFDEETITDDEFFAYLDTYATAEERLLPAAFAALSSASSELYRQAYGALPGEIIGEMAAFSQFFEQYRHSVASQVSETVNNTFLVMHGTEGTKSYGMVVDLAVAYYRSH